MGYAPPVADVAAWARASGGSYDLRFEDNWLQHGDSPAAPAAQGAPPHGGAASGDAGVKKKIGGRAARSERRGRVAAPAPPRMEQGAERAERAGRTAERAGHAWAALPDVPERSLWPAAAMAGCCVVVALLVWRTLDRRWRRGRRKRGLADQARAGVQRAHEEAEQAPKEMRARKHIKPKTAAPRRRHVQQPSTQPTQLTQPEQRSLRARKGRRVAGGSGGGAGGGSNGGSADASRASSQAPSERSSVRGTASPASSPASSVRGASPTPLPAGQEQQPVPSGSGRGNLADNGAFGIHVRAESVTSVLENASALQARCPRCHGATVPKPRARDPGKRPLVEAEAPSPAPTTMPPKPPSGKGRMIDGGGDAGGSKGRPLRLADIEVVNGASTSQILFVEDDGASCAQFKTQPARKKQPRQTKPEPASTQQAQQQQPTERLLKAAERPPRRSPEPASSSAQAPASASVSAPQPAPAQRRGRASRALPPAGSKEQPPPSDVGKSEGVKESPKLAPGRAEGGKGEGGKDNPKPAAAASRAEGSNGEVGNGSPTSESKAPMNADAPAFVPLTKLLSQVAPHAKVALVSAAPAPALAAPPALPPSATPPLLPAATVASMLPPPVPMGLPTPTMLMGPPLPAPMQFGPSPSAMAAAAAQAAAATNAAVAAVQRQARMLPPYSVPSLHTATPLPPTEAATSHAAAALESPTPPPGIKVEGKRLVKVAANGRRQAEAKKLKAKPTADGNGAAAAGNGGMDAEGNEATALDAQPEPDTFGNTSAAAQLPKATALPARSPRGVSKRQQRSSPAPSAVQRQIRLPLCVRTRDAFAAPPPGASKDVEAIVRGLRVVHKLLDDGAQEALARECAVLVDSGRNGNLATAAFQPLRTMSARSSASRCRVLLAKRPGRWLEAMPAGVQQLARELSRKGGLLGGEAPYVALHAYGQGDVLAPQALDTDWRDAVGASGGDTAIPLGSAVVVGLTADHTVLLGGGEDLIRLPADATKEAGDFEAPLQLSLPAGGALVAPAGEAGKAARDAHYCVQDVNRRLFTLTFFCTSPAVDR